MCLKMATKKSTFCMNEKEEKRKKRGEKILILFFFNIGPYDRLKIRQKTGKNLNNFQGGGKKSFLGVRNISPCLPERTFILGVGWAAVNASAGQAGQNPGHHY